MSLALGCHYQIADLIAKQDPDDLKFYASFILISLSFCTAVSVLSRFSDPKLTRVLNIIGLVLLGLGLMIIGPIIKTGASKLFLNNFMGPWFIYVSMAFVVISAIPDMFESCTNQLEPAEKLAFCVKISSTVYPAFYLGNFSVRLVILMFASVMEKEFAFGILALLTFLLAIVYEGFSKGIQELFTRFKRKDALGIPEVENELVGKYKDFYLINEDDI